MLRFVLKFNFFVKNVISTLKYQLHLFVGPISLTTPLNLILVRS
jgi:hypothetical protein